MCKVIAFYRFEVFTVLQWKWKLMSGVRKRENSSDGNTSPVSHGGPGEQLQHAAVPAAGAVPGAASWLEPRLTRLCPGGAEAGSSPPGRRIAGFGRRAGRIRRAERGHLLDARPLAYPGGLESARAGGKATLSRDWTLPGRCSEPHDVQSAW